MKNTLFAGTSLEYYFIGIVLLLTLIWLKRKALYIAWITGETVMEGGL